MKVTIALNIKEQHRVELDFDDVDDRLIARELLGREFDDVDDPEALAEALENENTFPATPRGMTEDYLQGLINENTWLFSEVEEITDVHREG